MTRRCLILWTGLLLALAAPVRAGTVWRAPLPTVKDSGVDIEFSSPVNCAPPTGYMPCWVSIRNRSGAAHTWTIHATERERWGNSAGRSDATQSLRVENEATARMPVLLPLPPVPRSTGYYRPVTLQIEGYGVYASSANVPPTGYPRKPPTAFIAMGAQLAVPLWEPLKKDYEDNHGHSLAGSPVEVSLLGSDWRGYSGFDGLWLTETEYACLDPDRQTAIRHWIDQGGTFLLCTQGLDPALRAGLGLNDQETEAHPGFGSVKLLSWDGKAFSPTLATDAIDGVTSYHDGSSVDDATDWNMVKSLGHIPLKAPFLIGFILVFAVLVGPVNLFWLAKATRRHRLFWTTPLISLAASLLLMLTIALQDGFGGYGERVMLTLLCPDQKEAVVMQEQATRTGVILSGEFTATEDLVLLPIAVHEASGKAYEQSGHGYGGDWFTSRSVQAQRAEAIVPSRAEIQLLNADAANAGAPPVVASSLPAALKEIRYLGPGGRRWRGGSLRTGEHLALQPDPDPTPGVLNNRGSSLLIGLQKKTGERPGCFVAVADDGPFIETLASIRWQRQQSVYVGPVTAAP